MKQEDSWNTQWEQVMLFMESHKRRPSKHRIEEHKMLNWIKYNKKLLARQKLSQERLARFNTLLALAGKYRKVNQHAYLENGLWPESGGETEG